MEYKSHIEDDFNFNLEKMSLNYKFSSFYYNSKSDIINKQDYTIHFYKLDISCPNTNNYECKSNSSPILTVPNTKLILNITMDKNMLFTFYISYLTNILLDYLC